MGQTEHEKDSWAKWLENYGARNFLDVFLRNAQDCESRCIHCSQPIYLDVIEGGGVTDWKTSDGDYGCISSPDTSDEGTGSHFPRKLAVKDGGHA